jgi:hypothetical protein
MTALQKWSHSVQSSLPPSSNTLYLVELKFCTHQTTPIPPLPSPPNNHSTFCRYECDYSINWYECVHIVFVVLDWLIAHSIMFSSIIHIVACGRASFLLFPLWCAEDWTQGLLHTANPPSWIIFRCVVVPHFAYLVIYWWTRKLLPSFEYGK